MRNRIPTQARSLLLYFDFSFFLKFLFLLLGFYNLNIFFLGITTPAGQLYSPFLEKNCNYIAWITSSILYTSKLFVSFFGLEAYIEYPQIIRAYNGAWVNVWLPCLGLGITGFWIAFVVSHVSTWQKKLLWSAAGALVIWVINCWRIALLLLALDRKWHTVDYVDHHTLFNVVAYSAIGLLIYLYYKDNNKEMNYKISQRL